MCRNKIVAPLRYHSLLKPTLDFADFKVRKPGFSPKEFEKPRHYQNHVCFA